ncbi:hypothetical protein BS78_05G228100 [Paspalum vaginatum]|nr:hypothetical protein BS78_05G228100 [Paspalum vaginatum]KAJ1276615.1 hypothetical protein BS78_05G228100 [Paspalum vaginatum]
MENRAGRGRERHGEAAGGRGPGARGGRRHNGKKEGGPGHGAAGDRQGMLRRHGEEANAGGGADCSGGRASHNGERPNLGGHLQEEADDGEEENASRGKSDAESQQALALKVRAKGPTLEPGELQEEPEDAEEGNASGGKADAEPGSLGFAGPGERPNLGGELQEELQHAEEENASGHSADAQPGSLGLGGPGDQSVQRGEKKETSRTLSTAPADDAPFVSSGVPSGGGADLVDASATSKEQTICSAVVPEEKKLGSTATATPTSTLPPSTFLTEAVLSWTIRNVLDDNLYKEKVKCIPAKFDSTQHIIDVYSAIIMEETRSVISSRIQNKTGTQYCQLKSIKQCASPHVYYLDVDLQMTRSDEIHCHHIAKDFDVCLLSPKCSNDPDLDVMSCSLGLVIGVGRDTYYQKSFRVLVSNSEMFQQERTRFVGFLTNIKYNMEIAKIMSLPENGNNIAVQALMDLYKTVGEKCKICSVSHCNDDLASINKKTGEYNVTSVISNITSSLSCAHQNHTEVVWAPPRTMKVCISALMKSFLHLRLRVLVCLPKKELISDFLMDIDDFLGSSDAFGDVVVLNSLRGLDNCSNFERAFLENRSHELYCCLRLCKCSLKVMSNLLDLSGFHHSPRCLDFVTCKRCSNLQLIPFSVKLFAERFMDIFMHLNKYLVYLVNNSSVFCLSREHCDNIEELLDLMKQLEAILYNKDLREDFVEVALKLIPAINGDVEDNIDSIAKSLNENRISCLRLIAKLSDSLELPQLEDLNDVDRLCIQHSKIIIASFDSMWKLHELEMDAFDMLIVSGSNQIKDLDLLLPLNLPVHHTIFFGDHFLAPPVVESKLCKEAGFGKSIYERLQQLTTQQQILTHQYGRHEFIDEIINCHIYNGILEVSPNAMSMEHNTEVESLSFPSFSVMNVPTIPSSYSRKGYVLSATLFILLQKLSKGMFCSHLRNSRC